MYISMIKLESNVYYIIDTSVLFYYSYLFRIEETSDPYSYSYKICYIFVFDNIYICFENIKTDMESVLSNPHLISFHP
jgi:hypothetical protein